MINGVGISVGFTIAIIMLAGVRERIEYNDVPHSFKGSTDCSDYLWPDGDSIFRIFRINLEGGDERI